MARGNYRQLKAALPRAASKNNWHFILPLKGRNCCNKAKKPEDGERFGEGAGPKVQARR